MECPRRDGVGGGFDEELDRLASFGRPGQPEFLVLVVQPLHRLLAGPDLAFGGEADHAPTAEIDGGDDFLASPVLGESLLASGTRFVSHASAPGLAQGETARTAGRRPSAAGDRLPVDMMSGDFDGRPARRRWPGRPRFLVTRSMCDLTVRPVLKHERSPLCEHRSIGSIESVEGVPGAILRKRSQSHSPPRRDHRRQPRAPWRPTFPDREAFVACHQGGPLHLRRVRHGGRPRRPSDCWISAWRRVTGLGLWVAELCRVGHRAVRHRQDRCDLGQPQPRPTAPLSSSTPSANRDARWWWRPRRSRRATTPR